MYTSKYIKLYTLNIYSSSMSILIEHFFLKLEDILVLN